MVEYGAAIKLDSRSAIEQMRKFANQTTDASKKLRQFQAETKATAQGLGGNVFRGYINSSRKVNVQTERSIAAINEQTKSFKKLSAEEKKHIQVVDKLNQKYDESARNEAKLTQIRKEMRMLTVSGLKTEKEAIAIYNKEAKAIDRTTVAYKQQQSIKKAAIATNAKIRAGRKAEISNLRDLKAKYDSIYAAQLKDRQMRVELNTLVKAGIITQSKYNKTLVAQRKKMKSATTQMNAMAKAARIVSVYSRVLLGLYAASRIISFATDLEITAEKVKLLSDKLEFLTGDSGAYRKLFDMTQEVGINMEAANKIITRFAVVTNRAFDIDTMNEWSATLIRSARATGTSTQEMSGALIQITQAMSAGRLMGDEYRSVTENLPLLTVALRDMFGKSTLSLKELSSQGLITNDVMVEAFGRLKVLLEGFPDSTQTVEASFGRLSSAWDDFVATMVDSTFTKDVNNNLTFILSYWKDKLQGEDFGLSNEEILKANEKRAKKAFDEEVARYDKLKIAAESLGAFSRMMSKKTDERLAESDNKVNKLTVAYLNAKQAVVEYNKQKIADDKIQAIREENRLFKEELKTIKLIAKVEKGKSVETINKELDLLNREIDARAKLYRDKKEGELDSEKAAELRIKAAENAQDQIDKVIKREIDSDLRLAGFKTKFNIDQLQEELNSNSKLYKLKIEHAKKIEEINSAAKARELGLAAGQKQDQLSGMTPEMAAKLIADFNKKLETDTIKMYASQFNAATGIVIEHEEAIRDLDAARANSVITDEEYATKLKNINDQYYIAITNAKSLTGELAKMDQIQSGLEIGFINFANSAGTLTDAVAKSTETLLDGTVNAILDRTKSAKDAFADLINTMLMDLQKFALKSAIIGIFGGGGAPLTSGTSGTGSISPNANGGVYNGPGISSYSGSVVSSPTLFPFANGTGLMGEDGEEAILPLKRGSDGKLGVSLNSQDKKQTSEKSITVRIKNEGSGDSKIVSSKATTDINGTIIDVVLNDLKRGGPIRDSLKNIGEFG